LVIGLGNAASNFAGNITDAGGASSNTGGSIVKIGTGTVTFSGTNSYAGNTMVNAGSLVTTAISGPGTTLVAQNALLTASSITQSSLKLEGSVGNTTGKATINASGSDATGSPSSVSRVGALSIANNGTALVAPTPVTGYTGPQRTYYSTLDLKNNDLVVDNTPSVNDASLANSLLSSVTDMVRSGSSSTGSILSPDWNGKGISSSYVSTQGSLSNTMSLGVMRNVMDPAKAFNASTNPAAYGVNGSVNNFDGIALPGNEILVKYTWNGDANLDGKVDSMDFALLDAGFAGTTQLDGTAGWFFGDFNYNGVIDSQDYSLASLGYNGYSTGGSPSVLPPNTQLPEPSTLLLGGLGLAGLLAAYRRRRQLGK